MHVVNTNVSINIFVNTNVMLLLTACGCLRAVLNVKKFFLYIFCDVQNLYIYIYIYLSAILCWELVVLDLLLGTCDVGM